METIGSFDAKTRLSELLGRASRGESFVITRHGHPVARLLPMESDNRERVRAAAERLRGLRGALKGVTVDELNASRREGHRF